MGSRRRRITWPSSRPGCSRSSRTSLGTVAVVVVAARSFRARPLGNALIVAGVVVAAAGSGLAGLGAAGTSVGIALGAVLLYAGFVAPPTVSFGRTAAPPA